MVNRIQMKILLSFYVIHSESYKAPNNRRDDVLTFPKWNLLGFFIRFLRRHQLYIPRISTFVTFTPRKWMRSLVLMGWEIVMKQNNMTANQQRPITFCMETMRVAHRRLPPIIVFCVISSNGFSASLKWILSPDIIHCRRWVEWYYIAAHGRPKSDINRCIALQLMVFPWEIGSSDVLVLPASKCSKMKKKTFRWRCLISASVFRISALTRIIFLSISIHDALNIYAMQIQYFSDLKMMPCLSAIRTN